jgi:hypothetical protein
MYARYVGLDSVSTDGYLVSEVGKNVIDILITENYQLKDVKEISLDVDTMCKIQINDGKILTVNPRLGLFRSTEYEPVKKLVFMDAGVNYFISAGY